jgi:hypothetical protein
MNLFPVNKIKATLFAVIPLFPFIVLFIAFLVAVYHIRVYW